MLFIKQNKTYFIVLSILIFLFDQITKYLISLNIEKILNRDFLIFTIEYVKNYGAAFNILSGNRIFLSTVSFFITILLIYYILKKNNTNILELYSFSFVLGGTLGNGIDRIIKGFVIDFINFKFINFPTFNIADISINIGFLLILYSLVRNRR